MNFDHEKVLEFLFAHVYFVRLARTNELFASRQRVSFLDFAFCALLVFLSVLRVFLAPFARVAVLRLLCTFISFSAFGESSCVFALWCVQRVYRRLDSFGRPKRKDEVPRDRTNKHRV